MSFETRNFSLFFPFQAVSRISQVGTKSVFAQSGNSREVIPNPFNQTQTTAPQTRYMSLHTYTGNSYDDGFWWQHFLVCSTTPQVLSPTIAAPPNVQPRRSSRLFTSASSTAKVLSFTLAIYICIYVYLHNIFMHIHLPKKQTNKHFNHTLEKVL